MPGVTDPSQAYFKDGSWSWDGSVWRKQPLLFGYSGVVAEYVIDNDLAAGVNDLDTAVVPAGYIWTITNIGIQYTGTPPTEIEAQLYHDAGSYRLFRQLTPTSNQLYDRQGKWVLDAGDLIRLTTVGATLHDGAQLWIVGFATAIAG